VVEAKTAQRIRPGIGVMVGVIAASIGLLAACPSNAQERINYFGDPFLQVTQAVPGCPVPEGPLITLEEMRAQSHGRADRGTSCFRSGRCRLPNAFLYDKEIIPRVKLHIGQDDRFTDTSIWIMGQRRWVYLMGCVASEEQSDTIEREVRGVDDVEAVINELMIGSTGKPRYRVLAPAR
jgi:hypothetical protein